MKRKIIALMLMLCMIFQTLSITISASTTGTSEITRDTVLVLDNSVSMEGSPLVYLKQAAIKFCNSVLSADGTNRVAVVVYDTNITKSLNFTDDIDALTGIINGMDAEGKWTNINSAVEKADELLKDSSAGIKNLVVMTDGVPTSGDYKTTGRYSYNDYAYTHKAERYCYEYANSLYDTAIALHDDYSIYSLGFYHTMASDTKAFAAKVLKDIQNAGYYEVENIEDLEFVFGEVAGDITQTKAYPFKFAGFMDTTKDTESVCYYTDNYFFSSPLEYDYSLATMSLCLELSAWTSHEMLTGEKGYEGWNPKIATQNVENLFASIGFSDFKRSPDIESGKPTADSIGAVAAKKVISDGNDEHTLVALVLRGGGYGSEWASNFKIGMDGNHQGFNEAKESVLSFLNDYLIALKDNGSDLTNMKLWIVGYSRGGITANMVAGSILQGKTKIPSWEPSNNLYCYCFETPRGILEDSKSEIEFKNIHNVINHFDLVPMVAPEVWGFTRYGYEHNLPYAYTNSKYNDRAIYMIEEFAEILNTTEWDIVLNNKYKIKESYNVPTNVEINWTKILPGGDPFVSYTISEVETDKILKDTTAWLFKDVMESRILYSLEWQDSVRELTAYLLDSYDKNSTVLKVYQEKVLEILCTPQDYVYILKPMFEHRLLNSSFEARLADVNVRIEEKFTACFEGLNVYTDIPSDIITLVQKIFAALAEDVFFNNANSIPVVVAGIYYLVESQFQGHYPEICLAWVRSEDPNYNESLQGDTTTTNSSITRVIHINCPVDVNVYDSTGKLVASIINDIAVDELGSIVCLVNSNGEKIIYLPGDEDYRVDIIATDDGYVSYAVNEYNFVYGTETRILNYYNVPVATGDVLKGLVPKISDDELQDNTPDGSTADYQLLDKNSDVLPVDTEYTGEQINDQYFDVTLQKEGNGGYVTGAGKFLEGHFAQVTAQALPSAEFYGWYEGDTLVSDEMTYRFAVTKDITLTAKFNDVEFHEMKLAASEGGKITSVEGVYSEGIQIAVVAEPDEGYVFDYWTTSDGGTFEDINEAYTFFTMPNNDVTVTAHFKAGTSSDEPDEPNEPEQPKNSIIFPKLFNVNVKTGEGGKTDVSDTFVIAYGASRTIKITPNEGYAVADVVVNGKSVGAVEKYTIKGACESYNIQILFEEID